MIFVRITGGTWKHSTVVRVSGPSGHPSGILVSTGGEPRDNCIEALLQASVALLARMGF